VIPLFKKQINDGKPLTVTDPEMTRFVMSIDDAVALILKACEIMKGGEVFILKMPVLRLGDLVDAMKELHGHTTVERIESKPGEKIFEDLMTAEESKRALETEDMFIVLPEMKELLQANDCKYGNAKKAPIGEYSSKGMPTLSKNDIKSLIRNID
jgi:FlaA1/EpsC-like NDP-sugar epimerase